MFVSKISNSKVRKLPLMLALICVPSVAGAVGIADAPSLRDNFAFGDIDSRSFDGAGFDLVGNFSEVTTGDFFQLDSFSGAGGTALEITLLSEVCGFCGQNPNFTNAIGVLDDNDEFVSVLDAGEATVSDSATFDLAAGEEFTLALQSPETVFSSIDSDNIDESAHLIATTVEEDGRLELDNADLFGSTLMFDLMAGDIIVFVEDLIATGNRVPFVPENSDFDFNDLVFVVREVPGGEVPEPGTLALLALGACGLAWRKRSPQEV